VDGITNRAREERIRTVMDELGVDEETAAFAVALVDGKTTGCVRAISFPQPEDEAHRRAELLVEYLGFTPSEAARYVAGDRTVIEVVAARRREAESNNLASHESQAPTSRLSAD
jgi:hypothetical protein